MARHRIRFLRRGRVVELADVPPMQTLLDYLRLAEKSRGTKEGCAEGDCGACTVALGSLRGGCIVYEPVNACILLMGQVDGKEVVAVDDLARGEALHPVQHAMVDAHASQCGFCTPGFVMSLFTLYHAGKRADRAMVLDHLAGNLCRCTGYRPIVDAALQVCAEPASDDWTRDAADIAHGLERLADGEDVLVGDEDRFLASPASLASLAALYQRHPDAILIGGATDVGLWITKQLRDLGKIIVLHRVAGLDAITETASEIAIGAAATYAMAEPPLAGIDPDVAELLRRIGGKQVRASGTVGGNIANGSPIGDTPPMLIALGAELELRRGTDTRTMPLESFFISYGKQDRAPGEFVLRVTVPKLTHGEHFRCYKISKRFDQDISAVLGAFKLTIENKRIVAARVAFGGMAATPKRGLETECALSGARIDEEASWTSAIAALARDYQPIGDHRASAAYRQETAQALLAKALHEIAGRRETRIIGPRGEAA